MPMTRSSTTVGLTTGYALKPPCADAQFPARSGSVLHWETAGAFTWCKASVEGFIAPFHPQVQHTFTRHKCHVTLRSQLMLPVHYIFTGVL